MEFLALLAGALLAILLVTVLFRAEARRPPPPPPRAVPGRVGDLCEGLSGDANRDRPLMNRLLALGPGIVADLIDAITGEVRSPDGVKPARLARLEELVADFGLAAVPTVTDALARLQPTAPVAPSLLRVLHRLGPAGVVAILRRGLGQPELAPFLPRFRDGAGDALVRVLRDRPAATRADDLTRLAGLLAAHPETIVALYDAWDPAERAELLVWLADWLPLADPALVRRALEDTHPAPRAAAARLVRLMADAGLVAALATGLDDGEVEVRRSVAAALASHPGRAADLLLRGAADADAEVAGVCLGGLMASEPKRVTEALAAAVSLSPAARAVVAAEDAKPALAAVDEASDPVVIDLAIRVLGLAAATDPRARERLIRMADAEDVRARVDAVRALSSSADTTVAELLSRVLRDPPDAEGLVRLQEAAQTVGEAAVLPLARRMRPEPLGRVEASLAVLRAQPYATAVAPLLRGLEDARSGFVEGQIAATLFVGGAAARERIYDALEQPSRGLLVPALRYLAAYAGADDVPLLLSLFDRHLAQRTVLLNLMEAQGSAALPHLDARIDAGGDDGLLEALEERRAVLRACAFE